MLLAGCGDDPDPAVSQPTLPPVVRETLLDAAEQTVLDQLLEYPAGSQAQVTAAKITFAPGQETGWHFHETPLVVFVLAGTVTVTYDDGNGGEIVKEYTAGDTIIEAIGTHHTGRNLTDEPVVLYTVSIGAEGLENTVAL